MSSSVRTNKKLKPETLSKTDGHNLWSDSRTNSPNYQAFGTGLGKIVMAV